ncbi:hypothetical protein GCM10020366_25490 [Saccharopolyspora gregorii]|uniref:Uncharacterized protein n=1 Tax=Saccharopolyspora gregorii TaxID=33914 RepID=A0ABP6RNR2_9PSEU
MRDGIFGRLAGGRLPGLALVGAALIIIGTPAGELKPRPKSEVDTPAAELSGSTTRWPVSPRPGTRTSPGSGARQRSAPNG